MKIQDLVVFKGALKNIIKLQMTASQTLFFVTSEPLYRSTNTKPTFVNKAVETGTLELNPYKRIYLQFKT